MREENAFRNFLLKALVSFKLALKYLPNSTSTSVSVAVKSKRGLRFQCQTNVPKVDQKMTNEKFLTSYRWVAQGSHGSHAHHSGDFEVSPDTSPGTSPDRNHPSGELGCHDSLTFA